MPIYHVIQGRNGKHITLMLGALRAQWQLQFLHLLDFRK